MAGAFLAAAVCVASGFDVIGDKMAFATQSDPSPVDLSIAYIHWQIVAECLEIGQW